MISRDNVCNEMAQAIPEAAPAARLLPDRHQIALPNSNATWALAVFSVYDWDRYGAI